MGRHPPGALVRRWRPGVPDLGDSSSRKYPYPGDAPIPDEDAYPSDYDSENEYAGPIETEEEETARKAKENAPFPFMELPVELRVKVYSYLFENITDVIDLDPDNFRNIRKKQSIFYVCRRVHDEASHYFYSSKTFRIFPTYPGRFFKTKKPLLARLSPRCRACLTSLELRLGPGFANPPRGWVINEALGLKDMVNVRTLKVMVQVDTSSPMYNGFRAKGEQAEFYENFSRGLLDRILNDVPSIIHVQMDGWPGVEKDGLMIRSLSEVVRKHKKIITWGTERGWDKEKTKDIIDSIIAQTALLRIDPDGGSQVTVH